MGAIILAGLLFLVFLLLKLYGRVSSEGGRSEADSTIRGMEFELSPNNSTSRAMVRFSIGFSALVLAGAVVLFVAGEPSAPYIGASAVAVGAVMAWTFHRSFSGTVELRSDALVVRLRQVRQVCPWSDIERIGVASWTDAPAFEQWFVRATGADLNERFVEVGLRRQLRASLIGTEQGPHIFGVPFGQRRVRVFVANPETVADMAQSYLRDVSA